MQPFLFVLTGFPGTGKLTVARNLVSLLEAHDETVRLIDNHAINNVVFRLIEQDGLTPLAPVVWDRVGEVWVTTLRTVEEISPRSWHTIFTAYLDGKTDTGWLPRLEEVASVRGSVFVPVRLLCDPDENARRIVSPERREMMKSLDPEEPHRLSELGPPYDPDHVNQLTLDITSLPAEEAAALILEHGRSLASNQ